MSNLETKALICGYGAFGRAIHVALSNRPDISVAIYSRSTKALDFPAVKFITEIRHLDICEFDIVFLALPSTALRSFFRLLNCNETGRAIFISCVKGLDKETLLFPSQVIQVETKSSTVAVLSGASFADEMVARNPVFIILACANPSMGKDLVRRLQNPAFNLNAIEDIRGLEVAGVGKNIIAIGSGIIDGLGLGENVRAAFIAQGIVELGKIASRLGGRSETLMTPECLADIILTSSSLKSRNYRYGKSVAVGLSFGNDLSEGAHSTAAFLEILKQRNIESSYFKAISAALDDAPTIMSALLARN